MDELEQLRLKDGAKFATGSLAKQKEITEEQIKKDGAFAEAFKIVDTWLGNDQGYVTPEDGTATKMTGELPQELQYEEDQESLAEKGMQMMSDFKNALYTFDKGLGLAGTFAKFKDAPKEVKDAAWYLFDTYDRADNTLEAFGRGMVSIGKDPTTYTPAIGAKFFGQKAAQELVKNKLKSILFASGASGVMAGGFTAGEETLRQELQDVEEYDLENIALMGSIGAIVGTVAVPVIAGAGAGVAKGAQKLGQLAKEGEEEMIRLAGGGTPDDINQASYERLLQPKGEFQGVGVEKGTVKKNGLSKLKSDTGSFRYVYTKDGEIISALQLVSQDGKNAQIANVYTKPEYQKQGIATELFNKAQKDFKSVKHSEDLSEAGKAFKSSVDGDLIIQHNLSEENIAHAEKMGGIPAPSLAITNKGTPLEGFGEITMLGDKELATPSAKHKVFGADIYSPRYPYVTKEFSMKDERAIDKELGSYNEKLTGRNYIDTSDIKASMGLKAKFLESKGEDIEPVLHEVPKEKKELLKEFSDINLEEGKPSRKYLDDPKLLERIKQHYLDAGMSKDDYLLADEENLKRLASGFISQLKSINAQLKSINAQLTRDKINGSINKYQDEYSEYTDEYMKSHNVKEKLRNGSDRLGRTKFIPHTLDNVVRKMKTKLRGGEDSFHGAGSIRAIVTPQFKTLKQIQANKDKLISKEEFSKVKDAVDTELLEIRNILSDYKDNASSVNERNIAEIMETSLGRTMDNSLKDNGFSNVPKEVIDRLEDFKSALVEMPTEYFESKMLRAMDLGEFKYAVIPSDASEKTKKILENKGIEYSMYDRNLDNDRISKIKEAAEKNGYLFALPITLATSQMESNNE